MPNTEINVNVLNTVFQDILTEEINRETTLLNLVQKVPFRKDAFNWAVNVGGATTEGVAITADAPNTSQDTILPASLGIKSGSFQSAFQLNSKEILESAELAGAEELKNVLRTYMTCALDELMANLNRALYVGTGAVASAGVYGLSQAINTVDYAGIDASTHTLWQTQTVDLWDTSSADADKRRTLETADFLRVERLIRERMGRYDILITTPKVLEVYKGIFENNRTYNVYVQGQGFVPTVDLGFTTASYGGRPIIDDSYCGRTRDASETAQIAELGNFDEGVIYFAKLSDLKLLTAPTDGAMTSGSGVFTQMEKLAKTGLYVDKYAVGTIPQLVLTSRKNTGRIINIAVGG